jgi:hypothetical protein
MNYMVPGRRPAAQGPVYALQVVSQVLSAKKSGSK